MKRILFFTVFVLLGFFASAQYTVSADEAKKMATKFSTQNFEHSYQSADVKTLKGQTSKSAYAYIINLIPEGWVMVSADKRIMPIIGYSPTGFFDSEALPGLPFYFWFSNYGKQIEEAQKTKDLGIHKEWSETKSTSKIEVLVEPIIQVEWNQGKGWNDLCPVDADGPGGHVYAGCVAVAMGQAMSVYGHPSIGTGSKTHNSSYGSLYANFAETDYKWGLTDPKKPNEHSALILYHLGISVSMGYSADASGAQSSAVPSALKRYFDYSNRTKFVKKDSYKEKEWTKLLTNELTEGRPIYYAGNAGDGKAGHAFNVDGVDDNDRFHFNWGWSGSYNGFFYLTSLTPGSNIFTSDQHAVIGFEPRNHEPTDIILSKNTINEGLPVDSQVAAIQVIDETIDDLHTFEVRGMKNPFGFEMESPFIVNNYKLYTTEVLNYEDKKTYGIIIKAIDIVGHEFEKSFVISVNEVIEETSAEQQFEEGFSLFYGNSGLSYSFSDPYIGNYKVFVTDVSGRVIFTKLLQKDVLTEQKQISIGDVNPGIYIFSVQFPGHMVSQKIYIY